MVGNLKMLTPFGARTGGEWGNSEGWVRSARAEDAATPPTYTEKLPTKIVNLHVMSRENETGLLNRGQDHRLPNLWLGPTCHLLHRCRCHRIIWRAQHSL